jgi:hypothetical protein
MHRRGELLVPEDRHIGETISTQISTFLKVYDKHIEKDQDREFRHDLSNVCVH